MKKKYCGNYRVLEEGDIARKGEKVRIPWNATMSQRGLLNNIKPEERTFCLDSATCHLDSFQNVSLQDGCLEVKDDYGQKY
jgi:hypothetical protein